MTEETGAAMVEHPNATLMRRFFEAFGRADRDDLAALVTEDLTYHFPGTSAYAGDYQGVDGLLTGIRAVAMALGQGHNGFELLKVYADDNSAVTVHRDTFTGPGNTLDLRYMLYVRIEEGRMAEVWEVPFDQAENDRYIGVQTAAYVRATSS